jgi:hypothetical protein
MDKLGIKATIYDLLGYIVPGFLSLFIIYMWCKNLDINWITTLNTTTSTTPFYILIFILAYVTGQVVSSLSSFIFESRISKWISDKVYRKDNSQHNEKCLAIFGKEYDKCEKQILIAYCQKNSPVVYETAFIFLTIYGLSRNISIAILLLDLYFIQRYGVFSLECIIVTFSMILMIRNYFRFKNYFHERINSSLYL